MTYSGTVKNGVVVFDGKLPLPEGVRVKIEPEAPAVSTLGERLLKHAGGVDDLPADMAENHDKYIHGRPGSG
jgi:hypothetical protein